MAKKNKATALPSGKADIIQNLQDAQDALDQADDDLINALTGTDINTIRNALQAELIALRFWRQSHTAAMIYQVTNTVPVP